LLYYAHRELESLTMDRETLHAKELIAPRYSELVYYGLWHSSLKKALDAFLEVSQANVTGRIDLELYKGNINTVGRKPKKSLYWEELATFEREEIYNQKDAEGFINLFGLPLKVESIIKRKGK